MVTAVPNHCKGQGLAGCMILEGVLGKADMLLILADIIFHVTGY